MDRPILVVTGALKERASLEIAAACYEANDARKALKTLPAGHIYHILRVMESDCEVEAPSAPTTNRVKRGTVTLQRRRKPKDASPAA